MEAATDRVGLIADLVVDNIEERFEFIDELGAGVSADVYQAAFRDDNSVEVAIKIFNREALASDDRAFEALRSEIDVLRTVSHPNVVKLVETVCDAQSFCIVLEMCGGGELFLLIQQGAMVEQIAKEVFAQVVLAVAHLHENGMAHRDIKAENILLVEPDGHQVKLIDFGSSAPIVPGLVGLSATAHYVAPEVLHSAGYGEVAGTQEPYTAACDLWSLGVLLYVMLSTRLPFSGPEDKGKDATEREALTLARVAAGRFEFAPKERWKGISIQAKALIASLLTPAVDARMGMAALMKHPWCADTIAALKASPGVVRGDAATGQMQEGASDSATQSGDQTDYPAAATEAPDDGDPEAEEQMRQEMASHLGLLRQASVSSTEAALAAQALYEQGLHAAHRDAQGQGELDSTASRTVEQAGAEQAGAEQVADDPLPVWEDHLPQPQAQYLAERQPQLEQVLGVAASAAMDARPQDVLSRLAFELAIRAPHGSEAEPRADKAPPEGHMEPWTEDGARADVEMALEISLGALIWALPEEPLSFLADSVRDLAEQRKSRSPCLQ